MVSSPKPPDPEKTAQAQAGMNRDTAITQQQLNMVDQYTPTGSLTYAQNGNNTFTDAKGRVISTPKYSATTTLTPQQQAIFDKTQGAQTNLAGLAQQQSGFLKNYLAKPFQYTNRDAENWAYDLGAQRLDPRFAKEEDSLRTRLLNSGIREGTDAYDSAFSNFSQSKNDAYNNLMLTGRQQGFTEALAGRNQPLNEITALMSGSQVAMPQFQSTPQTGVGGVDYTGLVNQKYQGELQQSQAAMGGLFGLAAAPFAMFSDRRLKQDIRCVGMLFNGIPVYAYRMGDGPVQIGVMADEVAEVMPEAVHLHPSGFKMVDYGQATGAI